MSAREVVQQVVGVVSLVLIALLLVLGTRPASPPGAVETASGLTGSADAQQVVQAPARADAVLVLTGRDDVADRLQQALDAHVALHRGQGFATGPGLFTALPADLAGRRPAAVVLQGGEPDVADPARAARALEQMLDRVRAAQPADLPVVVVGPLAAEPSAAPPALRSVRDALESAARTKDVPFLDPLRLDPSAGAPVIEQLAGEVSALLQAPVAAE